MSHAFPGLSARASLKQLHHALRQGAGGGIPGPQRPGLIEAPRSPAWCRRSPGGIPGPQRPGLIEARLMARARRTAAWHAFPGLSARASLKHAGAERLRALRRAFPGLSARASLKQLCRRSGCEERARIPGPQRPGLIEALTLLAAPLALAGAFPGLSARASLKHRQHSDDLIADVIAFPGLSARASLKPDPGGDAHLPHPRIPGPQRPGLIEAERITDRDSPRPRGIPPRLGAQALEAGRKSRRGEGR